MKELIETNMTNAQTFWFVMGVISCVIGNIISIKYLAGFSKYYNQSFREFLTIIIVIPMSFSIDIFVIIDFIILPFNSWLNTL